MEAVRQSDDVYFLPTSIEWRPREDIGSATIEAENMQAQYYRFLGFKQSAREGYLHYFDRECIKARVYMMDSSSFLIDLRRRGYKVAMQDMEVERTVIDEDFPRRQVVIPSQANLFVNTGPSSRLATRKSKNSRQLT